MSTKIETVAHEVRIGAYKMPGQKAYTKKEIEELKYQLAEDEYIEKLDDDTYLISKIDWLDHYKSYWEAEDKILKYYQNKFSNEGMTVENIDKKLKEIKKSREFMGFRDAFIDKYNPNTDLSIRFPDVTEEIVSQLEELKIMLVLQWNYILNWIKTQDRPEGGEIELTYEDQLKIKQFYNENEEFIKKHIGDQDFEDQFNKKWDEFNNRESIKKMLSEIIT